MTNLCEWEISRYQVINLDLVFLEFNLHKTNKQRIVYFWVEDYNFDIFWHELVKTSIVSVRGHYIIVQYILYYIFK